jgi:hypothetical protein
MQEQALAEARTYFKTLVDDEITDALTRGSANGSYAGSMRLAAEKLAERFRQTYVPPTRVARLYAYADERDMALQWLEKAHAERDFEMVYLGAHPDWDGFRSDRRFQDLLQQMKFPN